MSTVLDFIILVQNYFISFYDTIIQNHLSANSPAMICDCTCGWNLNRLQPLQPHLDFSFPAYAQVS